MIADRTMMLERVIAAPVSVVWGAWMNPETLPLWWGPDGFTCRTKRIDLLQGGEWVFDMIGPNGKVWPNHHCYTAVEAPYRIAYSLQADANGPKIADAEVMFQDQNGATLVTLRMTLVTDDQYDAAFRSGAAKLGLQTLGKLAAFIGAP